MSRYPAPAPRQPCLWFYNSTCCLSRAALCLPSPPSLPSSDSVPGRPRETNGGNGTIHFSSCSQAFPVCYRVGNWASSFSFLVTPLGHGLEDWPWPCCGQRGVEQSETVGFHGKNPQLSVLLVHISQTFS